MNKSRSNVFIMLNLIVSFFISACSSPREQVKIENGTFNINGKDVQLICGTSIGVTVYTERVQWG